MARPSKVLLEKNETLDIAAECPVNLDEFTDKAEEHISKKYSVYDKKFANMLIKHMTDGYDFQSFAKVVGVSKQTLDRWVQDRVTFKEAKEIGEEAYYHHWLDLGLKGAKGLIKGYNASTWIFTMKNKFGWKDIVENHGKNDSAIDEVQVTTYGRFASARPKIV